MTILDWCLLLVRLVFAGLMLCLAVLVVLLYMAACGVVWLFNLPGRLLGGLWSRS